MRYSVVEQICKCLEKNIALALVNLPHAELGSRLTAEAPHGPLEATVVPMPFYDPKKTLAV